MSTLQYYSHHAHGDTLLSPQAEPFPYTSPNLNGGFENHNHFINSTNEPWPTESGADRWNPTTGVMREVQGPDSDEDQAEWIMQGNRLQHQKSSESWSVESGTSPIEMAEVPVMGMDGEQEAMVCQYDSNPNSLPLDTFDSYPTSPIVLHPSSFAASTVSSCSHSSTSSPWLDLHTASTDESSHASSRNTPPGAMQDSVQQGTQNEQQPPQPAIANPLSAVYQRASSTSTSPTVAVPPAAPAKTEKRACIPCRRMKLRCDEGHPCSRCSKQNRECTYRSEAEVEAAKLRRIHRGRLKRPNPSNNRAAATQKETATVPATQQTATVPPPPPPPPSHSPLLQQHTVITSTDEATEQLSSMLYSRSYLAVLVQAGFRDAVLQHHAVLEALQPALSIKGMIEWHLQISMMVLQISDTLTTDDFSTFIKEGLSEEQLSSPTWLNSPLAPWAKLATRPLHYCLVPNTAVLKEHLNPPHEDPTVAELRIEILPSSHIGFQRWLQQLGSKIHFQYQLKRDRSRNPLGADGQGNQELDPDTDADMADLVFKCKGLHIARALQAPPPIASEHDECANTHACWCPLGMEARDSPEECNEPKVKKRDGMTSVHASTTSTAASSMGSPTQSSSSSVTSSSPASSSATAPKNCLCSMSTPLPSRLYVNDAFQSFFGHRRTSVERGMQLEGFRWHRRLYPPSTWLQVHRSSALQALSTVDILAEQLIRKTCPGIPADMPVVPRRPILFSGAPPNGSNHKRACQTKSGKIMALMKGMEIIPTDGLHKPTTVSIKWQLPGFKNETEP